MGELLLRLRKCFSRLLPLVPWTSQAPSFWLLSPFSHPAGWGLAPLFPNWEWTFRSWRWALTDAGVPLPHSPLPSLSWVFPGDTTVVPLQSLHCCSGVMTSPSKLFIKFLFLIMWQVTYLCSYRLSSEWNRARRGKFQIYPPVILFYLTARHPGTNLRYKHCNNLSLTTLLHTWCLNAILNILKYYKDI